MAHTGRYKRVAKRYHRVPFDIACIQIRRVLLLPDAPKAPERDWLERWIKGTRAEVIAEWGNITEERVRRAVRRALYKARMLDHFAPWYDGDEPSPPKGWKEPTGLFLQRSRACKFCTKPFHPTVPQQRYCNNGRCQQAWWIRRNRELATARRRAAGIKPRALPRWRRGGEQDFHDR